MKGLEHRFDQGKIKKLDAIHRKSVGWLVNGDLSLPKGGLSVHFYHMSKTIEFAVVNREITVEGKVKPIRTLRVDAYALK